MKSDLLIRAALTLLPILSLAGCGLTPAAHEATSTIPASGKVGQLAISVLGASMARDWSPQVQLPGPDGGSPLGAKVQLRLTNSGDDELQLTFAALIRDTQGRAYPATFLVLPGPYKWNGSLAARQELAIEMGSSDGPYLPVGSTASVVITWTTQKGDVLSVQTSECEIKRYG